LSRHGESNGETNSRWPDTKNRGVMNCRDFRNVADSFLSNELLTDTSHEVLLHLDSCPSCRAEIAGRRRLRDSLRAAFDRAPDLRPRSDFAEQLRDRIRVADADVGRDRRFPRRWQLLAASVLLAAGVSGVLFMTGRNTPVDALATDAIGDHWNCALKHRAVRTPVPLEEAAQRFDSAYRVLLEAPPDDVSTRHGPARVVDRHSCAFGTRRFGHVILEYRQHVVSLLVTADDERTAGVVLPSDVTPQLRGAPVNGLSVASIRGARHAILLVSDLEGGELTQLSTAVAVPLVEQLANLPPAPSHFIKTLSSGSRRIASLGARASCGMRGVRARGRT
jgi:putative zinc finger protein